MAATIKPGNNHREALICITREGSIVEENVPATLDDLRQLKGLLGQYDLASSAASQHYIDTGELTLKGEQDDEDEFALTVAEVVERVLDMPTPEMPEFTIYETLEAGVVNETQGRSILELAVTAGRKIR
jgi:hypothetical protein